MGFFDAMDKRPQKSSCLPVPKGWTIIDQERLRFHRSYLGSWSVNISERGSARVVGRNSDPRSVPAADANSAYPSFQSIAFMPTLAHRRRWGRRTTRGRAERTLTQCRGETSRRGLAVEGFRGESKIPSSPIESFHSTDRIQGGALP